MQFYWFFFLEKIDHQSSKFMNLPSVRSVATNIPRSLMWAYKSWLSSLVYGISSWATKSILLSFKNSSLNSHGASVTICERMSKRNKKQSKTNFNAMISLMTVFIASCYTLYTTYLINISTMSYGFISLFFIHNRTSFSASS